MSIKPILVPDQDAKTLRALLESFDAAASGPTKKQLTESVEQGVAEGSKIVDQDSDLDQQIFTLSVDGNKVSFTYWDYENNFQNPDINDIYQQAKEQLGKKLSPEQIKDVARTVFKSFKQGVAEEQLDEISKEKLGWYLKKASANIDRKGDNMIKRDKKFKTGMNPVSREIGGATQRTQNIAQAAKKYNAKDDDQGVEEGFFDRFKKKNPESDDPRMMPAFQAAGGYDKGLDVMGWQLGWKFSKLNPGVSADKAFQELYYGKSPFPFDEKTFKLAWNAANEQGVEEGRDDDDIWTSAKSGGPKGLPQGRRGQTGREMYYDWSKKYDDYAPDDEGDDWYDDLDEDGVPHNDPNLAKAYRLGNEAYKAFKNDPARAQAAQDRIEADFPQYAKMWLTGYRDGERFDKHGVVENFDSEEYNDEAGMAHSNLITIARAAEGLLDTIDDNENLPEWAQEKIAKVEGMLVAVWDYLESQEQQGIDPEIESESFYESAAWKRKEGKSKTGGLNAKGVASYRREHPGSKLQTAVTTKPSKLKPGSKAAKRRKSFCARMSGVKGPMKKPNGEPTRKALALRKWNCESIEQSVAMLESVGQNLKELKQRLDPKCWKGKKIGNPKTKIKGGVRVNNCVPANESINESVDPVAQLKKLL